MKKLARVARTLRAFTREITRPLPVPTDFRRPKIGLALGGGFARGLAHIGVLKVLEEENIPIDFVGGTSVGSVIGAAYCSGLSPEELQKMASAVRFKHIARWTLSRLGFASNDRMAGFLKNILKVRTFEELRIPLAVAATDFVSGEGVLFRSGDLIDPVRASCAYPAMFLPVSIDGKLLIDGMLAHAVPTTILREMGADRVIAVYLSANWVNLKGPRHVFDVIGQCFSIAQQKTCSLWQKDADLVIQPDVRGFSYDNFDRAEELVKMGEIAAREMLPTIKSWLVDPNQTLAEQKTVEQKMLPPHPAAAPAQI